MPMPRKTDGMEFKLLPRPTKGDDGQPLLYVRPASNRKYNMQGEDSSTKPPRVGWQPYGLRR